MATTGTYTYNPTASAVVTEALRTLGVLEEGTTASTTQVTDSLPAFEMYIKSLSRYGLNLWAIETQSITLTAACNYTSTKKFLKITDAIYRDSTGDDTIMINLTRQEYWNLSDKASTSQPTQYYYDPQGTALESKIYIWPCPDTTAYGSGETLEVTGQVHFEDVGDGSYTLDIPQEWLETIKYGVAVRLAPMYGYPPQERNFLVKQYEKMLEENLDWDTEQESIYLQPDYSKESG